MSLQQIIAKNTAVVFTTASCPFCIMTKKLLNQQNVPFDELNINESANAKLFEEVEKQYKHDTVPAVFIKSKFIGGNSELQAANSNGELAKLLGK